MKTPDSFIQKLHKRKEEFAFRELMTLNNRVDFFSNDYLGIAKIPFESKLPYGSTGSRLISGNTDFTEQLEKKLADFFKQESGLLFNSGYDANLGIFSCVPQKGDTILYDELIHASIRDGIRLSLAKSFSFKHNNLEHLEQRIKQAEGNIYVATESVFSMDGDIAPLKEIALLCKNHNAFLIVDEAHSGGVFGEGGRGLITEYDLDNVIFCKLITFGKAYGSHGAIVLGSKILRDYLINFSRPFIYSTAMSLHSQERISFVVDHVAQMYAERKKLVDNISAFQNLAKEKKLKIIESASPVQSIILNGNEAALLLADKIRKNGFAVKAILSPTVPKGSERIRICLHSFNTKEEIKGLINCLS